jgi:hypothetical protein
MRQRDKNVTGRVVTDRLCSNRQNFLIGKPNSKVSALQLHSHMASAFDNKLQFSRFSYER